MNDCTDIVGLSDSYNYIGTIPQQQRSCSLHLPVFNNNNIDISDDDIIKLADNNNYEDLHIDHAVRTVIMNNNRAHSNTLSFEQIMRDPIGRQHFQLFLQEIYQCHDVDDDDMLFLKCSNSGDTTTTTIFSSKEAVVASTRTLLESYIHPSGEGSMNRALDVSSALLNNFSLTAYNAEMSKYLSAYRNEWFEVVALKHYPDFIRSNFYLQYSTVQYKKDIMI